ncbi:MAG: BON domain-containing protein [Gemmatimonadetes bacterium]|nr:BON domain-containing protein [Gemmatimonadota bacterium]
MWHRDRESELRRRAWVVAAGAGVGLAAGLFLWNRSRLARKRAEREEGGRLARMEDEVVDRLRADAYVAQRPIEVAALADGIIELSGTVATEWESDRAAMVAQGAAGVRTVLNRLDVSSEVERLDRARSEEAGPGTARTETHWYGVSVGTGARRQGRQTDPARRDDRVEMIEEELDVREVVRESSEGVPPAGPGIRLGRGDVEGELADRGTEEAD